MADRRRTNRPIVLSTHYKRRHRIPTVDLEENPFCTERQMSDEIYLMHFNKNPVERKRTMAETLRSDSFLTDKDKSFNELEAFKGRVIRQAMNDLKPKKGQSRVKVKPPPSRQNGCMFAQSTSGLTLSFGHRPQSASRTFNPLYMDIKPVAGQKDSNDKPFLTTSTLLNLLYPPVASTPTFEEKCRREEREVQNRADMHTATKRKTFSQARSNSLVQPEDRPEWDRNFCAELKSKHSDPVPRLNEVGTLSSTEKLTRFREKSAGVQVPAFVKERAERDRLHFRTTSGTFFPVKTPALSGDRVITPRTIAANKAIQRILRKQKEAEQVREEKIQIIKELEIIERIPKVKPLEIPS